ncbi:MAG: exonuclease subunit SbcD [Clostridiales bacterium]|nr:exonuclease subunit SbcD [Clostridiales bacterium]
MRLLHTGDWHLGKQLEGVSRIEEQEKFLEDFKLIIEEEAIDVVMIAGDVYDTFNPSSKAETLFYQTLKDISNNGKRLIVVIPGNHDNPNRLVAASPLAREHGIIMVDSLNRVLETGTYGQHQLIQSGPGFIEVEINGEKAVILTVPYPSEKRLEEAYLEVGLEEVEQLEKYNDKIRQLFETLKVHFREDTINVVMSHLFAMGAEETGSERSIQLGGSYIIDSSCFPKEADYIALGHIHKPMVLPNTNKRIRYSGSPLQYNKKERHFQKGCYIIDAKVGNIEITFTPFKVYKPIEVWQTDSIEHAIELCEVHQNEESYVYLEIQTDRYIQEYEIKSMKRLKRDILEITPIIDLKDQEIFQSNITEEPIESIFKKYYLRERQTEPTEEITSLLLEILGGTDEAD